MKKLALLIVVFVLLPAIPAFAHEVEFVVLGGANVRFQYSNGQPMSNAEIHVLCENGEIISTRHADDYGVFSYEAYFGTAARLEARCNNFTVRFIIPEALPRTVYNDRGELLEIVVPAGSGGRLSAVSLALIYIGAAAIIGFAALTIIAKKRKPITGAEIALSRRMPRSDFERR